MKVERIGLWGFYGLGNLGDTAIQQAVIENIRRRQPAVEVTAVCLGPDNVSDTFGIAAYPIYRGPVVARRSPVQSDSAAVAPAPAADPPAPGVARRFLALLKKTPVLGHLVHLAWSIREDLRYLRRAYALGKRLDILLVSGSGVLDDTWKGAWKRPFALYRWCLMAKLAGAKVVFMSIGATSLRTRLGSRFGKLALETAVYRSFRDEESRDLARKLGVAETGAVMPDLAWSLDTRAFGDVTSANAGPTVAIGPIPYCDPRVWPKKDQRTYRAYVEKIAQLIDRLVERGFPVRFIVGQMHVDRATGEDILETLSESSRSAIGRSAIGSVKDLMEEIARADYVVTSRFHGVLLPYLLERPVLALSYDTKIRNLMTSVGQGQFCLDIQDFDVPTCLSRFEDMTSQVEQTAAALRSHRAVYQQQLGDQYDRLFGRQSA